MGLKSAALQHNVRNRASRCSHGQSGDHTMWGGGARVALSTDANIYIYIYIYICDDLYL